MTGSGAKWLAVVLAVLVGAGLASCDNKPSGKLAPISSSLAPARPRSTTSEKFLVQQKSSRVDFLMAAPIERIHGRAPGSVSGQLFVDLSDLTKSQGLIKVDLDQLAVYQSKRKTVHDQFGDENENARQNEHMRTWLQISQDAPKAMREANRYVEFKIDKVDSASPKNVFSMKGNKRKVDLTVTGDFLLHGRKVKKTVKLAATFDLNDKKVVGLHVESAEPVSVSLEAHDIRPRESFEKLAEKTLAALGQKVAKIAPVSFSFDAKPETGG